jgi:hypothetical protein
MMYFLILLLIPLNIAISSLNGECGRYTFRGRPVLLDDSMIIMINEGTLSEITVKVPNKDILRLAPYIGVDVSGEVAISEFVDSRIVEASNLSYLDTTIGEQYLTMKEKGECK